MKLERIKPEALLNLPIYAQAVKITEGTLVYAAGQVAWDAEGNVIGDDLRTQAEQAFRNIGHILDELEADWENVVKLTIYVAQYDPEAHRSVVVEVMRQFLDSENLPANTLLGVQSLARKELLIEVEAIIAID